MKHVKIGGAVAKYNNILLFNLKHRELLSGLELTYYDMPNDCAWNGGRINRTITLTQNMLDTFNKFGYGLCLGFTNNVIMDVGDEVGNQLLNMVNDSNPHLLHGVVLQSENLRRYIRRHFPKLKLTYSITGHPTTDQLNFEGYYRELEDRYDVVVPKYSHLPQVIELLESGKLNPEKYEILVNDNCNVTCQFYSEHFAQIAHVNNTIRAPWEAEPEHSYQVEIKPKTKAVQAHAGNCMQDDVGASRLQRFYDTGVRHFKISGRDLTDEEFDIRLKEHLTELSKVG